MASNILIATFDDESKTYQAFSDLKRAAGRGHLKIEGMTIIHRTLDGRFEVRDAAMKPLGGAVAGGIIGSLMGILVSPLWILLGWGAGSLIGGIRDARELRSDQTLFRRLTENMEVGSTALVGEFEEPDQNVANQIVRKLGGELLRRPTAEVQADIEAAEHAQEAASREARRVIHQERPGRFPGAAPDDEER